MSIDFEKLYSSLTTEKLNETQKRAILNDLADITDERAKKTLELLSHDKSTAIKLLASSYLKKNFSGDTAAARPASSQSGISGAGSARTAQQDTGSADLQSGKGSALKSNGIELIKSIDAEFFKSVIAPFIAIIILGLFSPQVPAFFFFMLYLGLIISVSLFYDRHIALPVTATACVLSMILYAVNFTVNFRPTILLILTFLAVSYFISSITTDLRDKLSNSKTVVDDFKIQIMQLKKLIDKKKDTAEIEKDMDELSKLKLNLTAKSRKLNEVLIQIHELISNQKTDEIIDRLIKILTRQLEAKTISLWIYDSKSQIVYPMGFSDKHPLAQRYSQMNIPIEYSTPITAVANRGGIYTKSDLAKISQEDPFSNEFEIKTEFVVAMNAGNKIVGIINCEEVSEGFELTEEVKRLIKLTADVSAWALKNAGDLELSKKDLQNIKNVSEKEREEKKKIRSIFDKFVSPKVIENIMNNPDALALGGKRRNVTLFFADIRGFTSMSEAMADRPEIVLEIVNRFHSAMTDIIIAKGGTVDKYIGDALMAIFGAPVSNDVAKDALAAVSAAVLIREECTKLREQLIAEGKTAVNVGIGLNTGEAVIGMVGSTKMMNYTAIGDTVNTAARIESKAGPGEVLISKATYNYIKSSINIKEHEALVVKGKKEPLEVFEVVDVIS